MKAEFPVVSTPGWLVLADGSRFRGKFVSSSGAPIPAQAEGEVVFNTAMSGYQEVITDPSYAGQILSFTNPHIGNYGVNPEDLESAKCYAGAVVVREYTSTPSNWRATEPLHVMLERLGVPLFSGVDTRRLTRLVRERGALPGVVGIGDPETLGRRAKGIGGTDGRDLVGTVSRSSRDQVGKPGLPHVVAYDFGIKNSILRELGDRFTVTVVPADTTAGEVLALEPDGIFLSNGPGDPAAVEYGIRSAGELLGNVPIFGICLGHQLLALSQGASTSKLRFGHHGANHPVSDLSNSKVEITSQNHNYAVEEKSLQDARTLIEVSHVNLNDGVLEGLNYPSKWAFSVQYHPEAGPGPHDSLYLFDRFATMMGDFKHDA